MFTGPNFVKEDLVLYLDAANPKSYSGTGSSWNDLSGIGNNATFNVAPTLENGVGLKSENNYCLVDTPILSSNITITTWFKFNTHRTVPGSSILVGKYLNYILYSNNNSELDNLYHFVYYNGGHISLSNFYNIPLNSWIESTVTFNSLGECKTYRNGNIKQSISPPSDFTNWIFEGNSLIDFNVAGHISETETSITKIYNKALTETEVKQNYNALKGRFNL